MIESGWHKFNAVTVENVFWVCNLRMNLMGESTGKGKANSFLRNVGILVSGTAISQVFVGLAMPFVARLYSPSEIGIFSLFMAFVTFVSVLASLRYESALMVAERNGQIANLLALCLLLTFSVSILGFFLYWLLYTNCWFGFGELPGWTFWFILPLLLGSSLFNIFRALMVRFAKFAGISRAVIARGMVTVICRLSAGYLWTGTVWLFSAELIGLVLSNKVLFFGIGSQFQNNRRYVSRFRIVAVAKRFRHFLFYEFPSVMIDHIAVFLVIPAIVTLYGLEAAGVFVFSQRLVALPNTFIGSAVGDVFQMEFSDHIRKKKTTDAINLFWSFLRKISVFAVVMLILIMIFAPLIFPPIFGEKWVDIGNISAIIAPWVCFRLVVAPLSRLLAVVERQDLKLVYDVFILIAIIAVFQFSIHADVEFKESLILLSGANFVAYGLYMLLIIKAIKTL